jgi:TolB-like protein/class 3 adenylate cyclase/Flp pilus assembly protein TadD
MAILAADVANYSRLVGADEEGTLAHWKAHWRELIEPKITEHHGRIVRIAGDGLLLEFGSAVAAVRCAVEVQRAMAERNGRLPQEKRIEFRMGINVGDVIVDGSDMWGEGVNVAARLEALAEPGGICVSGRVQEDVHGRLEVAFDDMGERRLKNIARSVRVYRVRLDGATADLAPALPEKPSIAVLPFDNMSDDPGHEYFVHGIEEEIITALSRMRWLFVIARDSSSTYKGGPVDVKQVGRDLGVRYVLEGGVRKAANRVRITAQLIDSSTGAHVWANRFEGTLEDIFDLQNQVTASVVGAIAPQLEQAEIEPAKHRPTQSLDAYDHYLRGMANLHRGSREARHEALQLFYKAIELDPDFSSAYGMAAWCYLRRTRTAADPLGGAEDLPLAHLLSENVYQDLVGTADTEERKRRIIEAPSPRPFLGVPPRIPVFTGRADQLERLDAILTKDKAAAVIQTVGRAAVQGLGGVGKTTLAIEYAYRFRDVYAGVCWCPAETRLGLLSSLAGLVVSLGAAAAEEADVEKAAKAALCRLAEQRAAWLLVYDNVSSPEEIADLLPSAETRVLITSRFSDWSGWAEEVSLDVLRLEEAVVLLQSRTGRSDAAGARILAEALGNLPLALDHAAAYCKRTQMGFAEYAVKASSLVAAAPRGAGYPRSVAATFNLAITQAVAQCPETEPIMAYLAQCSPERIPMTLAEGAVEDEAQRLNALAALAEVSLVKHDPFEDATPAVTLHRLVQKVARARSEENGSAHEAVGRLIARLVAIYPKEGHSDPQSWPLCAQLTPHLLALRDACSDDAWVRAGGPELLDRAGGYFHGRAAHSQAARLLRDALAIRESALGAEHPDTATSLNNLADLLRDQGDFAGARPLHQRALAIRERVLGPAHPDTATSLNNLAILLKAKGDFAGARPLHERALAIRETALGPVHPDTATSLNNLANLLRDQGDFARARPLHERALAIREKALGPDHSDTATSLNNLAVLLRAQGDFAGARPLFERALSIYEKALGPEHPAAALSLNQLALLLQAQDDFAGARLLAERAMAIREKTLGPEHPATARSLSNLAILLKAQGDFAGALPLHERALSIHENALGPEHPHTATSLNNLADLLQAEGDFAGALPLYERALSIRDKVLGPEHPETAASLNGLASLLQDQRDFAGALPLYQRALSIREHVLGPEHPDTATSLNDLACLLQNQGDFAGALPLYRRALAIREKVLAPEHPTTNRARCNLSRLLLLIGAPTEALVLGETALAAHDEALGRDHTWTKNSARVTADALGRIEAAAALRERHGLPPETGKVPASINRT